MSQTNLPDADQMHNHDSVDNDNFDNDDLIVFQLDSKTINLYYSQLAKYSKHIRDEYLFSDVINRFPKEIHKFKEDFQLSPDNFVCFFQLLEQNCNIDENLTITYKQCIDLLKISKYLEIRKLSFKIGEYIKIRNHNDSDFIIQMILYDTSTRQATENSDYKISQDIEELLESKIDECFTNEKFSELPISVIYRVVKKCPKEKISSNNLFDFIKKSISKFCVLFQFVDLQKLSEDRLIEMCDIYSKTDDKYFNYMGCNLNKIREMIDQLKISSEKNEEQSKNMRVLEAKIASLQNQFSSFEEENKELKIKLADSEKAKVEMKQKNESQMSKMEELEDKIRELQSKLIDTEKEKKELYENLKKKLFAINGEVKATVKNGLIVTAQIKLKAKDTSLDPARSKYIICNCDSEKVCKESYENGEVITSLEMETIPFLVKPGTYCIRCIVFDCEGESKEIVSNAVTTSGDSVVFAYEEAKPSKISLSEGQYKLEVWGAKGGDSTGKGEKQRSSVSVVEGGLGGYSRGILRLGEKATVHVFVGGAGQGGDPNDGGTRSGGFPDGGGTKTGHAYTNLPTVPGTGGGSTSIRIGSDSDYSRVIVAGGGGGASGDRYFLSPGGFGGGESGGNSFYRNELQSQGAGTQTGSTRGRAFNEESSGEAGRFGYGASGKYSSGRDSGGGGGGGWYGGGSGGFGWNFEASSGGGGSGWVFTASSLACWQSGDPSNASQFRLANTFYLTDAETFSGDKEFPRPDGNGTERGHRGHGFAKITPQ